MKAEKIAVSLKRLVKDFNILTEITTEDRSLFEKAKVQDLQNQYETILVKNSDGEPFHINCPIEDFKIYGPGIYLLFKFLKVLILIFGVMCIFAAVNICILASGTQNTNEISQFSNINTVQYKLSLSTLGNIQQKYAQVVPILYFISLVFFTGAIVFLKERQIYEVIQCSSVKLLPSYYTVILKEIPEEYSEAQLKQFLDQNFGQVKQIYSVKQFHNDLYHFKEINEIINDYKFQRNLVNIDSEQHSCLKLIKLFDEFYYSYRRMKCYKRSHYQPTFAFITLKTVQARQRLLSSYNQRDCFQNEENPEHLLFKNQLLKFEACTMQPDAINWQNISLSTLQQFLRILLQMVLLLIVLIFSIIVIYFLSLAKSNLASSDYTNYTEQQILQLDDPTSVQLYCLNLSISEFEDENICKGYSSTFTKVIVLELMLPLIISILKLVFTELMKSLVVLRRYANEIEKIQSQIGIIFAFYFIVSGVLPLVINLSILTNESQISIQSFMISAFGPVYNLFPVNTNVKIPHDFTRQWFFANSTKIILISVLSFNLTTIFDLFLSIFRKRFMLFMAQRQSTNIQKMAYLKGQTIQIQFIYSFVLNLIFFTLIFGIVIPIIWIFNFVALVIIYWVHKFIFVKYCKSPLVFSHSINHKIIRIIFFGICLSCMTTPLLVGGVQKLSLKERYMKYLYFPILGCVIIIYMFYKKYLLKFFILIKGYFQRNIISRNSRLPTLISRISFQNDDLPSYSMHENKLYEPVLKVLYTMNSDERRRNTFILNEHLNSFFQQKSSNYDNTDNPFKSLICSIKAARQQYKKDNPKSKYNPYGGSNRKIQNIFKLYTESKANFQNRSSNNNRYFSSDFKNIHEVDEILQSKISSEDKQKKGSDQEIKESAQSERRIIKDVGDNQPNSNKN